MKPFFLFLMGRWSHFCAISQIRMIIKKIKKIVQHLSKNKKWLVLHSYTFIHIALWLRGVTPESLFVMSLFYYKTCKHCSKGMTLLLIWVLSLSDRLMSLYISPRKYSIHTHVGGMMFLIWQNWGKIRVTNALLV
jgi:hypothetical protein